MLFAMVEKKLLSLIIPLFILSSLLCTSLVYGKLEIKKTPIIDTVVPETKKPAVYELELTNLGEEDTFQIYSLVGIDFYPSEKITLKKGETKKINVNLYPEEAVLENPGIFNFVYKIKGEKSGIQEDVMLIKIVNLKNALEINSYNIGLEDDKAKIYVRNLVSLPFPEIYASFHSAFFDFSKNFSLQPYEKKEFEVTLNKKKIKGLHAGSYLITADIKTYNTTERIENTFRYSEKEFIKTETTKKWLLIYNKMNIKKTNEGNLPNVVQIEINKDIFSRLFTTFNMEPTKIERKGLLVNYLFQKEIKPGESYTVKVTTNFIYPLIILIAIIAIILLIRRYTKTFLILNKKAIFVKTKGGEFALKISINVKARAFVEKICVTDKIPSLMKLHQRFGVIQPDKIDEKNKRLEWNIDSLQPDEERVFSYIIYSKIAPIGKFELPQATAIFEKDGKIHEAISNKVYFLTGIRKKSKKE